MAAEPVTIRSARPDDLPALTAIYNDAVSNSVATFDLEPFSVEQRRPWFERYRDDRAVLRVGEAAGQVVGYATVQPFRPKPGYRDTCEITVYVAPGWLGRGIGTALYADLIATARRAGIHTLIAVISGDNPASAALHTRFGFTLVGCIPQAGFKFERWVDVRFYYLLLDH